MANLFKQFSYSDGFDASRVFYGNAPSGNSGGESMEGNPALDKKLAELDENFNKLDPKYQEFIQKNKLIDTENLTEAKVESQLMLVDMIINIEIGVSDPETQNKLLTFLAEKAQKGLTPAEGDVIERLILSEIKRANYLEKASESRVKKMAKIFLMNSKGERLSDNDTPEAGQSYKVDLPKGAAHKHVTLADFFTNKEGEAQVLLNQKITLKGKTGTREGYQAKNGEFYEEPYIEGLTDISDLGERIKVRHDDTSFALTAPKETLISTDEAINEAFYGEDSVDIVGTQTYNPNYTQTPEEFSGSAAAIPGGMDPGTLSYAQPGSTHRPLSRPTEVVSAATSLAVTASEAGSTRSREAVSASDRVSESELEQARSTDGRTDFKEQATLRKEIAEKWRNQESSILLSEALDGLKRNSSIDLNQKGPMSLSLLANELPYLEGGMEVQESLRMLTLLMDEPQSELTLLENISRGGGLKVSYRKAALQLMAKSPASIERRYNKTNDALEKARLEAFLVGMQRLFNALENMGYETVDLESGEAETLTEEQERDQTLSRARSEISTNTRQSFHGMEISEDQFPEELRVSFSKLNQVGSFNGHTPEEIWKQLYPSIKGPQTITHNTFVETSWGKRADGEPIFAEDLLISIEDPNTPEADKKRFEDFLLAVQEAMDVLENLEQEQVSEFLNASFDQNAEAPIVKPGFWRVLSGKRERGEINMQVYQGRDTKEIDEMNKVISDAGAWTHYFDGAFSFNSGTGMPQVENPALFAKKMSHLIAMGLESNDQENFEGLRDMSLPQLNKLIKQDKYRDALRKGAAIEMSQDYLAQRREQEDFLTENSEYESRYGKASLQTDVLGMLTKLEEEGHLSPEIMSLVSNEVNEFYIGKIGLIARQLADGTFDSMDWGFDFNIPQLLSGNRKPKVELHAGMRNGILEQEVRVYHAGGVIKKQVTTDLSVYASAGIGIREDGTPEAGVGAGLNRNIGRYDQGEVNVGAFAGAKFDLTPEAEQRMLAWGLVLNAGANRKFEGVIKQKADRIYRNNPERFGRKEKFEAEFGANAEALADAAGLDGDEKAAWIKQYKIDGMKAAQLMMAQEFGEAGMDQFGRIPIKIKGGGVAGVFVPVLGFQVPVPYITVSFKGKTRRIYKYPKNPVSPELVSQARLDADIQAQIEANDGRDIHTGPSESVQYTFISGDSNLYTGEGASRGLPGITAPTLTETRTNSGLIEVGSKTGLDIVNAQLKPSGVYLEAVYIDGEDEKPHYKLNTTGTGKSRPRIFIDPLSSIEAYREKGDIYFNLGEQDVLSLLRPSNYSAQKEWGASKNETLAFSDNIHVDVDTIKDLSTHFITFKSELDDEGNTIQGPVEIVKIRDVQMTLDSEDDSLDDFSLTRDPLTQREGGGGQEELGEAENQVIGTRIFESYEAFKNAAEADTTDDLEVSSYDIDAAERKRQELQTQFNAILPTINRPTVPAANKADIVAAAEAFMEVKSNEATYKEYSTLTYNQLARMNYSDQLDLVNTIIDNNPKLKKNSSTQTYLIQKLFELSIATNDVKDPKDIENIMEWNTTALVNVLRYRTDESGNPITEVRARQIAEPIMAQLKQELLESAGDADRPTDFTDIQPGSTLQIETGGHAKGYRETFWNGEDGRMYHAQKLSVAAVKAMAPSLSEEDAATFVHVMLDRADPLNRDTPLELFESKLGLQILQAAPYYLPVGLAAELLPIYKWAQANPDGTDEQINTQFGREASIAYATFAKILSDIRNFDDDSIGTGITKAKISAIYKGETFTVEVDQQKSFGFYDKCINFSTELYEHDPHYETESTRSLQTASSHVTTRDGLETGQTANVANVTVGLTRTKEEEPPEEEDLEAFKEPGTNPRGGDIGDSPFHEGNNSEEPSNGGEQPL
jgi:hypothetical protein